MAAARLLAKGASQAAVARELGVSRESVRRWADALAEQGRRGLRKAGRAGRKPKLTVADLKEIRRGLKEGPEMIGFMTGLWTTARVAALIEQRCGVRYHPSQVWRILRQMGWSCQRPVGRALERDEKAIRVWREERWPAVKKTLPDKGARSSSSTRAASASDRTDAAPGRRAAKRRSSSTTSVGRRSRQSRG